MVWSSDTSFVSESISFLVPPPDTTLAREPLDYLIANLKKISSREGATLSVECWLEDTGTRQVRVCSELHIVATSSSHITHNSAVPTMRI